MTSPSTQVLSGDGSWRIFKTVGYTQVEAATSRQMNNQSRTRLLVFVSKSNLQPIGLGKVSKYRRSPIVARVSLDMCSVSTSTSSICIVRK